MPVSQIDKMVENAERMMEEKPDSVTIGTSVTNPMAITRRFLSTFEKCREAEKNEAEF